MEKRECQNQRAGPLRGWISIPERSRHPRQFLGSPSQLHSHQIRDEKALEPCFHMLSLYGPNPPEAAPELGPRAAAGREPSSRESRPTPAGSSSGVGGAEAPSHGHHHEVIREIYSSFPFQKNTK